MTIEVTPAGTRGARMPGGPLLRTFAKVTAGLQRRFPGRGPFRRMALIDTVGAKTGKPRTASVALFDDGPDRWIVVGSNAGAMRHPSWFHNLAHDPDHVSIEVGGRKSRVSPELPVGPERASAWERIVAARPGFAAYERKTDRVLPVVRLTPAP